MLMAAADEIQQTMLVANSTGKPECTEAAEAPTSLLQLSEQAGGMSSRLRRDTMIVLCVVTDELPRYKHNDTGDGEHGHDYSQLIVDSISDAIKLGSGQCQVRTWLGVQGAVRNL
jgi:thiamine phosphate synthase YjbQ (UPF0047 family)